jgi:tRNA-5-methyluridine54 2-sulfurtransferase
MRCLKCEGKAVIELRQHNAAYCPPHFFDYFGEQVRRNIRRHSMMSPEDRVLIAVSGGKDSLALWDTLLDMGYNTTGLHIHLGIGSYSDGSREKAAAYARMRNAPLIEVDLASEYGMGVTELSHTLRRVPCSGCGLSKRYVFNRAALEGGFTVVATGHNLDDEAATLLGNVLHWQREYLARQFPVLESTHPKFIKKVKPFYTLTERETALYCILRRIDYVEDECPNAIGAKSLVYKDVLNRLEEDAPGTKYSFLRGFFADMREKLNAGAPADLSQCTACGQPTTKELCAFCRMWDNARRRAARGLARAVPPSIGAK